MRRIAKPFMLPVILLAALAAAGCERGEPAASNVDPSARETNLSGNREQSETPRPADADESGSPEKPAGDRAGQPDDAGEPQPDANAPYGAEEAERIVASFEDLAASSTSGSELIAYLDAHIARVGMPAADDMFDALERFYETNIEAVRTAFADPEVLQAFVDAGYPDPEAADVASLLEHEEALGLVDGLPPAKYKLRTSEGIYYPVVDYEALADAYGTYLSDDLQAYVKLRAAESDRPSTSDAAIIVEWDELAERALEAESYLRAYPEGRRRADVLDLYRSYIGWYFAGSSNTEPYGEGGMLREDAAASFRGIAASDADTLTGKLAQDFLAAVEEAGGRISSMDGNDIPKPIGAFRNALEQRIRDEFGP